MGLIVTSFCCACIFIQGLIKDLILMPGSDISSLSCRSKSRSLPELDLPDPHVPGLKDGKPFHTLNFKWDICRYYMEGDRACFNENSSLHISIAKAGLQFLNDLFYQKISVHPAKFLNDPFCHCTNSLSSLHILIHHCTFCAQLHVKTSPGRGHHRS